jgi:cytochrome c oxidase assembly factor CtaG
MVQTGLLGALLALSPILWYPIFAGSVAIWGLTPLEDQQLAGLIMWVPMGAIYLTAGLIVTMIVVFGRAGSKWA